MAPAPPVVPPPRPSILHVDLDAFYASVEVLHDPSLAGRPVIVGGSGRRGVVASCSYEARAYGVRSAMPSSTARRQCPHAVFVHGRYDLYAEYSQRMHAVFHAFTPLVEGIALDEAFLDVSGAGRLFGDGPTIGAAIRDRIRTETGLSASVGVATTKFMAKLASEAAKPKASLAGPQPGAGVWVVEPGDELAFLHPLPVEALWGVGPATAGRLHRLGVTTVGDVAALPLEVLVGAVGSANGRHLHDLAWARDARRVQPERGVKSVSHEETYAHDLDDPVALHAEAVRLADGVCSRLRKAGLAGRTVTLKLRWPDFSTITRSSTLAEATNTPSTVARAAAGLLAQVEVSKGVRLLGVAVSNLVPAAARQLSLLDDVGAGPERPAGASGSQPGAAGAGRRSRSGGESGKPGGAGGEGSGDARQREAWAREAAAGAVDDVRQRFGDRAVGPAVLAGQGGLRLKRLGQQQWGPRGPDRPERAPEHPDRGPDER